MSRVQVAQALLGSAEYRGDAVNDYYTLYLGRSPSSDETNYWVGQLNGGMTQLSLQEYLVSSAEYIGKPPAATGGNIDLWTW